MLFAVFFVGTVGAVIAAVTDGVFGYATGTSALEFVWEKIVEVWN